MKKVILTFSTLLTLNTFASVATKCEEQAHKFGNGEGKDTISKTCFDFDLSKVKPQAISENDHIKVIGHHNRVYVINKSNGKYHAIAGIYTELDKVISVDIMTDRNEVLILQSNGDILVFSTIITGNVAPYRTIKSKDLFGSKDITYDSASSKIIVSNPSTKSILKYDIKANSSGREGYKFDQLLSSETYSDLTLHQVHFEDKELLGLNNNGSIYKLNGKTSIKIKEADLSAPLGN
ncbi:MAG: hypothetical protein GY909_08720 [Oligoflexia bacterium]|nr:hypothetical protein [Oligoflexia bacterium]